MQKMQLNEVSGKFNQYFCLCKVFTGEDTAKCSPAEISFPCNENDKKLDITLSKMCSYQVRKKVN